MSTDGPDASDLMGGGSSGTESEKVTLADLDDAQLDTYETLISRAGRYVRDGVMGIEDCSLGQILDDNEEPAEELTDAFHEAIKAQVDDLSDTPSDRQKAQQNQITTTDPRKINWDQVWSECNIPPKKPLSATQLELAIDVSDQTPVTDDGAERLIEGAVDAGVLRYFDAKERYAPTGGDRR